MYPKSDKIRMIFGDNIRRLRTSRGYSQEKFAKACNKSQAVISSWELGIRQPELDTIFEVADAFHVPVTSLIPVEASGSEMDFAAGIAELLHTDPRYAMLFEKARAADPTKLDVVLSMLDAIALHPEEK